MWGGTQHMILASMPPSQTHLPCLHSQIHHLLSLDTAEVWPFKGGVELWDPKSLRFLTQRTNGQIPELGCHGKDGV